MIKCWLCVWILVPVCWCCWLADSPDGAVGLGESPLNPWTLLLSECRGFLPLEKTSHQNDFSVSGRRIIRIHLLWLLTGDPSTAFRLLDSLCGIAEFWDSRKLIGKGCMEKKNHHGEKNPKKPVWDAKFLIMSKTEFLGSVWCLSLVHREAQSPPVQLWAWVLSRAPVAQVWAEGAPGAGRDWSNFRNWFSCVCLHCSAAMPAFQEGSLGSEGSRDGFRLSTRCQWTPCSCSPVGGGFLSVIPAQSRALLWAE